MNNPARILQTLERHLKGPTELTIFGRAALALGFEQPPELVSHSLDVDAIIPASQIEVTIQ